MNKKKGGKTAAVIDIGSNILRMQISQLRKGEVFPVDRLEYPVTLGHEVFTSGKISFESLRELSSILRGFSNVMNEYGVDDYRIVATTTALREALNKTFITDQLKIQNNMSVSILEDNQEKSLIFSSIFDSLQNVEAIRSGDFPRYPYRNGNNWFFRLFQRYGGFFPEYPSGCFEAPRQIRSSAERYR